MVNDLGHVDPRALAARRRRSALRSSMSGMAGALVMVLALGLSAILLVVFAATLAVIVAVTAALLAMSALAWRVRPRPQRAMIRSRSGHAWVSYSLDSGSR